MLFLSWMVHQFVNNSKNQWIFQRKIIKI
ncbi:uncharacterized protein CELE_F11A6.15 [Caenorhabditis elegans]|uniref:Uncharacterized protein n=1 Tax=Caenorhabditis elegans TaxID=6239 RepID=G3MU63_CAEEL|nr:Uncharacterized protein CELE_F11A6.15 [Caenorhabditis elegans]CCD31055.2 Uncharacterized protein CELE_F11A6.15 [Caenorhabditis elegans]|eukprot:NP_001251702.1 Uncharacterized protein CELE_F11A6.15 [Caenorhabditis elegans]